MSSICLITASCLECDLIVWRPVLASSSLGLSCLYEMFNEFIARPLLALVSNLITSTLFGIKFNISGKSEK